MTAVSAGTPAPPGMAPGSGGFGGLLRAEWTKIRSVRSTVWTMTAFVAIALGLTSLLTWLTCQAISKGHDRNPGAVVSDPVNFILGTGLGLGSIAIMVLGVLVMTGEYSSGTIRASILAVPRRVPMLAAKCLVFAALVLVVGEVIAFGAFFTGAAIFNSYGLPHTVHVTLSLPNVTRAVIGSGLYLTVLGLFSLAIGALIRHTAGAITTVLGLVLLIFNLTGLLPSSWGAHIHAYMPTIAGQLITNDQNQPGQLLSAWQGFGVFCGWTLLLLALGAFLLRRRDA